MFSIKLNFCHQSLLKMYILTTGCIFIQTCRSLTLYVVERTIKVIRLIVPFQK